MTASSRIAPFSIGMRPAERRGDEAWDQRTLFFQVEPSLASSVAAAPGRGGALVGTGARRLKRTVNDSPLSQQATSTP